MSAPFPTGDGWLVEVDGDDGATSGLFHGDTPLAVLLLDRDDALALARDLEAVADELAWQQASYLSVQPSTSRHLLAKWAGWETRPTLCGRRWPSWRADWTDYARPVIGQPPEGHTCLTCLRAWHRAVAE